MPGDSDVLVACAPGRLLERSLSQQGEAHWLLRLDTRQEYATGHADAGREAVGIAEDIPLWNRDGDGCARHFQLDRPQMIDGSGSIRRMRQEVGDEDDMQLNRSQREGAGDIVSRIS